MRGGYEDYHDEDTKTTDQASRLPYIIEKGEIVM